MLISVQESIDDEDLLNSGMGHSIAEYFPGSREDELGHFIVAA